MKDLVDWQDSVEHSELYFWKNNKLHIILFLFAIFLATTVLFTTDDVLSFLIMVFVFYFAIRYRR